MLIVGLGLICFETVNEIISSHIRQEQQISNYEAHIKDRMAEEVAQAVQIANFQYDKLNGILPEDEIRQQVVTILESLQKDEVGYFFGSDYQGNGVIGPNKGVNNFDIVDKNGLKVVQELIKTAQNGGGFVTYVMPSVDGAEQAPKLSYVMPFEPAGWYIGTGVNLSEFETIKAQIRSETIQRSLQTLAITGAIVIVMMIVFRRFNDRLYQRVEHEIQQISSYLDDAATGNAYLDVDALDFTETEQISRHTISLVEKRNDTQAALERANASLQDEIEKHATANEQLDVSRKRFESIVKTIPDLIVIMDSNGVYIDCLSGDTRWLDENRQHYIGKTVTDVLPPDIAQSSMDFIGRTLSTNTLQTHEYHMVDGDDIVYLEARLTPFQENQVFIILRNITGIKKTQLMNEYLSYHDQLTGAYNRRYFEQELIRFDAPEYLPIALVLVDVNGLKMTNDAFGHQAGDKLLCLITDILQRQCLSEGCFVARIGGDEFVIVCPQTSKIKMEQTIDAVFESINTEHQKNAIVSISVGWALKTDIEQSMADVFNKAEEIMYRKKLSESQSVRHQTVQAIIKTLNEKNVREKIHSERVSEICKQIGAALALDYSTISELETAGLLHDIGKIAVDDNILNKAGKLTASEYKMIKKHPEGSYQILKAINAYASLAEDVLSHHEHWDGTGYPRRLKGKDISLIARIISVADAYEAMTADRPYRSAMSKEAAMAELRKYAGTQFDPEIIRIFEEKVLPDL